ncbi:MAG TPA: glycosyltransferase [Sphingomicrobium sp.]|nr:glycosyltransferase [Sphingomicrobium sp.]
MSPGVLYISYDGMLEPLGQSQVLAYLEQLALGRRIHLISFEKPADCANRTNVDAVRGRIARAGIQWHPLRYHKSPSAPATAYDIAAGTALALALTLRHRIRLIHARSYVAGLMALAVKRTTGARFLFDMRGLWADERVDGGLWPAGGRLYRAAKNVERRLLLGADRVVTLTHASEREIRGFDYLQEKAPPITVIPTCADLDRFRIQGPLQTDPFVLGYVGSVGTWYLLDEMLRCFVLLREQVPGARLLIVNRAEHPLIAVRAEAHGIPAGELELVAASHDEMPALIARMSAAMALIKPAYSKIASAPTKLGEYLGCGVPCLGNVGVGDVGEVLEGHRVGVAVRDFSDAHLRESLSRLVTLARDETVQQRCRDAALELFSLERGTASYDAIYREMDASA